MSQESSMIKKKFQLISKKIVWIIIIILAVNIGLYPLTFIGVDPNVGLLGTKSPELISDLLWNIAFYIHISFGGISLLIGWILFIKKIRQNKLSLHRLIGKIYVITVLFSSLSGFYVAYYATGGIIAQLGFTGMSLAWIITTLFAYIYIRRKEVKKHENWMIRSYAVTFTGVTFRLWMPFLIIVFDLDFLGAYPIDAWISWIVNLIIADLIIRQSFQKKRSIKSYNVILK